MATKEEDDVLSGMNEDWVNVLVFNFFPFSVRGYQSGNDDFMRIESDEIKVTGSVVEHLDLPELTYHGQLCKPADIDVMLLCHDLYYLTGNETPVKEFIKVIQDDLHPLHCRLKVTRDLHWMAPYVKDGCFKATEFTRNVNENVQMDHTVSATEHVTFEGVNTLVKIPALGESRDYVPALPVPCPQNILEKLKTRATKARNSCIPELADVVNDLVDHDIYVVHKPHFQSTNPDTEWRFSFSLAERQLARSLNDIQRTVYRVLKALIRNEINNKTSSEDTKLPSYLIKTILFWVSEELANGFCIPVNIARFFFAILDKLIHFLTDGNLPQYFIPEGNLLERYQKKTMQIWIKSLQRIRQNPGAAMLSFWQYHEFEDTQFPGYFRNVFTTSSKFKDFSMEEFKNACKGGKNNKQSSWLVECFPLVEAIDLSPHAGIFCFLTFDFHVKQQNIVDFVRLYLNIKDLPCSDDNKSILDIATGCKQCQTAEFCTLSEICPNLFTPDLLGDCASMYHVRSLYDETRRESHEKNVIELFKKAGKFPKCKINYSINYAFYLMAKQYFEKAAKIIIDLLTLQPEGLDDLEYYLTCFLSPMLDRVLQMELCSVTEFAFICLDLLYHILCSCYIQAGVFAEVIFPSKSEPGLPFSLDLDESVIEESVNFIGNQYFLLRDYCQALKWYSSSSHFCFSILNKKWVSCVANHFSKQHL